MTKYIPSFLGATVTLHALLHLIGLYVYWPLGVFVGLPYRTTLLNGAWDVGPQGIQLYSLLWLFSALLLLVAAYGIAKLTDWWRPMLLAAASFSLAITALDWSMAYVGTILDVGFILFALLWIPLLRMLPSS